MTLRMPVPVVPMRPLPASRPFHAAGWVYEEHYDGCRLWAYKAGADVVLQATNAVDCTARFPDVAAAVARLPVRSALLDGVVVAFDRHLRSAAVLLDRSDVPILFAAFDCLVVNRRDLRGEWLRDRRHTLMRLVRDSDRVFPARRLAPDGLRAFALVERRGFLGMIAKDGTSPYVGGPVASWRSVANPDVRDAAPCGEYARTNPRLPRKSP